MKKEKTYSVRLTELEMNTLLKSVEETVFKGEHSEQVTALKNKLQVPAGKD